MESANTLTGGMSPKQPSARRHVANGHCRDIWIAARIGNVHDVEMALAHLKKTNGSIDARNAFGSSALHIASWRNHLPIVRRLLAAGADPNIRDGESGWSSLHRALHFGYLAVAGALIEAGGSLDLGDSKGRTPVDLTSIPLKQSSNPGATEVFSWGNGSNYQLGIGITGILRVPGRVDALQGLNVTAVAAAKFHTVALTVNGDVYSWGFGRGGRLGHPDFDIHSGQVAVITPRQIMYSFGSQGVSVIAVAKHHTVVATIGGAVYTWGSNREGRLGYPSVDTQPTPRRVSTLKARIVAVAAANKHSAVLTDAGEVYTWGCNTEGQLGYGTSNSTSNHTPRLVECLQGRKFIAVSTAKYHTVVLGAEGEVLTWGYRMVNPRRIPVVRYTKKAGNLPLKFHIAERLHVVTISAGMTHSLALSEDGLVFYWFSADRQLRCHQMLSMAGHQAVAVSSNKYRTAVVTSTGDVYSWDGENSKSDSIPLPQRVHGIKHATHLSVGENHSVVVAAVFIPKDCLTSSGGKSTPNKPSLMLEDDVDDKCEDVLCGEVFSSPQGQVGRIVPSLKDLCQRVAAQAIVEPKNAFQVLEFAESLGAEFLRGHCEELILQNLDYILTVAPVLFGHVRPSLLARVEKAFDSCLTQPRGRRRFSSPSVTSFPVIDSEDENDGAESSVAAGSITRELLLFNTCNDNRLREGFLQQSTEATDFILKQGRAARKKLQQIEALELKQSKGLKLDDQQIAKLETKQELQQFLLTLNAGWIPESKLKAHKQDMKNNSTGKSEPTWENSKSKVEEFSQPWRLEKKKCRKKASNESVQIRRVEADGRDVSGMAPSNKKPHGQSSMGIKCDSGSSLLKDSFVKISGFTSHSAKGSEEEVQSLRDAEGKTGVKGDSSLQTECSPAPALGDLVMQGRRKMTKRVAKGGLSVFLSGALDEPPKPAVIPGPVTPKAEGPAWGGAHGPTGLTSLREIQSQQKSEPKLVFSEVLKFGIRSPSTADTSSSSSNQAGNSWQMSGTKASISKQMDKSPTSVENSESSSTRVPLSQFVRTSPIAVTSHRSPAISHLDHSPPPWATSSSSSTAALSIRDIQLEQVKSKTHHRPSHAVGSPSGGSGGERDVNSMETPNRWFKPEAGSPSALRCIQIEEKAMKELRQLYKNVKLVRDDRN